MPQNKLNLSPLDPTKDKNRFDGVVNRLTSRIIAARVVSIPLILSRSFVPFISAAMFILVTTSSILIVHSRKNTVLPRPKKNITFEKWARGEKHSTVWDEVKMIKGEK